MPDFDEQTLMKLKAAAFERLIGHLRKRTDVQNIELMNLAGFCRNCLSNWMKEAADGLDIGLSKEAARELVYGMPYDDWKRDHQSEATPEQLSGFAGTRKHNH